MSKDRLNGGDKLKKGEELVAKNGLVKLQLQTDGNLVLHNGTVVTWASGTNNKNVDYCIMQKDGNLVIYNTSKKAVWSSGTEGHPGSYLVVQDDANTVIYYPKTIATWSTNTNT